jgi:hypothetical protein
MSNINLTEAVNLTHNYQNSPISNNQPISFLVERNEILSLLNQPNCNDFRIYMGLNNGNQFSPVVVGVDNDGNDMPNGLILGDFRKCPFSCPIINSPLMP